MARKENSNSLSDLFINKTSIDEPQVDKVTVPLADKQEPVEAKYLKTSKTQDNKIVSGRGRPASLASKAMKEEEGEKVPISARVSLAYKKRLKKAALEADKTVDGLIIELTEEWLKKHDV